MRARLIERRSRLEISLRRQFQAQLLRKAPTELALGFVCHKALDGFAAIGEVYDDFGSVGPFLET